MFSVSLQKLEDILILFLWAVTIKKEGRVIYIITVYYGVNNIIEYVKICLNYSKKKAVHSQKKKKNYQWI